MAEPSRSTDQHGRRLIFEVGRQRYEIDATPIIEVILSPHITRVPHGPAALEGIANLRGAPIPVLSLRRILGVPTAAGQHQGKIIVYDHDDDAIGLLVDDVIRLAGEPGAAPTIDLSESLSAAFKMTRRASTPRSASPDKPDQPDHERLAEAFLSFRVAGQLYGLPLGCVREVAPFGGDISVIPNAASAVKGLMSRARTALPLVSLASLLGLESEEGFSRDGRIVVVENDLGLIGLVVDAMDLIRRLPSQDIDPVPKVLQRGRGDAQIESIGRIAHEGRLMSILSPDRLFGNPAVERAVKENEGAKPMQATAEQNDRFETFLIFRLGDESYGLPVASLDEVIAVPDQITRVPGAPAFVMGVVNLRGKAIPLIDQRSRFNLAAQTNSRKARAIVVTLGSLQAGFVVDGVSEVRAVSSKALSAAPEFSSRETDVFDRIARIEDDDRMILVVDPQALLSRAEQDVVASIKQEDKAVADP